ncbi:hemocyte protein-glutamine gamma-glutamyltransferase-like isoform X1 [Haliotis rufescens]|uniref:hemocyte protein-glutamine gamma-glutamyltransferase-like isoform X1 n=2 Tax=Haliotis rufescens TaxID=6454 RepID=UPI00201FAF45|nr:hemocyte protein-glutamine gamma-glutamyltransferase-like isoform X1 [Haliotis rufescens]
MARGRSGRRGRTSSRAAEQPRRRRYNFRATRSRRCRLMGGDQEGRRRCMFSDEEYRKRIAALRVLAEAKAIKVSSVDLHKESNKEKHHTDEFEKEDLVIRRGQAFDLSITFDRAITKSSDVIFLQFTTGARPQESKGSLLRLPLLAKTKPPKRARDWIVNNVNITGSKLTATVTAFKRAIVGRYSVYVESKIEGEKKINRYELEDEDVFVLFNAWCKDDAVYMPDSSDRDEYVLRDSGRIWVGSSRNHRGRHWNFGQFDEPCLDAALLLLDNAELGDTARGSPVAVIRAISAMTNSNDDDGVLEGRWTETYPKNSTAPWLWPGSVAILEQFYKTRKPVKYGQCWVFSGVVTTLLRSLGIGTRSVTNFESAHDTDSSMTIDSHWDEEGEPVDWMDDSVWNFHVWNESFLRRLDLPNGYDGWQAHDSTPQECSEGVMRCGPASLKAIKEGHVYLSYDTAFVFSEVNGDKVHWQVDGDGAMEVLRINSHAVGKFISTKAKNSPLREDVTHLYKYPEGSDKERQVVKFVNQFSSREDEDIYGTNVESDVEFCLEVPETASVSEDFVVTMIIKNTSSQTRTVRGRMSVLTSYYTGNPAKRLKGEITDVKIQAKQQEKITVKVSRQEFQSKLNAEATFQACANYRVTETRQMWADTEAFCLLKPPLLIEVPGKIRPKEKYVGKVSFTNPLEIKVTGASIQVEGGSAVKVQQFDYKKPIGPKETISFEFEITPRSRGLREVGASFSSDHLGGIDGSFEFRVI